jgi:hypothetical protein
VQAVPCINICHLLLTLSSNLLLLISFDLLFELPISSSRSPVMNTMKIEPGALLVHTTTFLHNSETLGESKALQALTTKLYIVKYLAIDRLLQKSRGNALMRASTSSRRWTEQWEWAVHAGAEGPMATVKHQEYLSQRLFRKQQRFKRQQRAQSTTYSKKRYVWDRAGIGHTGYYGGVTPRPRQDSNAEWTFAEWTCPRTFRFQQRMIIHRSLNLQQLIANSIPPTLTPVILSF